MVPRNHAESIAVLEGQLMHGIKKFSHVFRDHYQLLGLGMHPTLKLEQTAVWDHDEGEYYEAYDRLFDIRQHGWLNIQALQVNLSYSGEKDLVLHYNRLRSLLPYLIAVTAASPLVEGRSTGAADNRLLCYRENQKQIPLICNRIVPEKIGSVRDYRREQEEIFAELRKRNAAILCEEWVNSGGVIIRFSRKCLEVKALDEQECIRSDMAVCAFIRSLLRCGSLPVETDQEALLAMTEDAIQRGTAGLRLELQQLYTRAWGHATQKKSSTSRSSKTGSSRAALPSSSAIGMRASGRLCRSLSTSPGPLRPTCPTGDKCVSRVTTLINRSMPILCIWLHRIRIGYHGTPVTL